MINKLEKNSVSNNKENILCEISYFLVSNYWKQLFKNIVESICVRKHALSNLKLQIKSAISVKCEKTLKQLIVVQKSLKKLNLQFKILT